MRITDLLRPEGIRLCAAPKGREEAIDLLITLQDRAGNLSDPARYKRDILAREAQGSTAIGSGIAVPHAKSGAVRTPGLSAATVPGGVDYDAPDGQPTTLFFMIAAPADGGDTHLELLSRLMVLLMDEAFCAALRAARTVPEFLACIDRQEQAKYLEKPSGTPDPTARSCSILAVTACPTGIAHTYMAAEALEKKGRELGIPVKAETQGSGGAKNMLTREEIAAADAIIIAADKEVDLTRFEGKPVLRVPVADGINRPEELIRAAPDAPICHCAGQAPPEAAGEGLGRQIYKQLMNGVSHMLPFVIGGGILIALAFLLDDASIDYSNFGSNTPAAAWFKNIGSLAFGVMLPILAGYIAMAIADRPGLMVGFVGGALAVSGSTFAAPAGDPGAVSGFLGALIAGFVAGYLMLALRILCDRLPRALEGIKPVLIYPVAGLLLIGLFMCIVNPFVGILNNALYSGLSAMGSGSKVLLGFVVAAMMAIDMGGPFNKAAYLFGTSTLATADIAAGGSDVMAAVMIGGMVPPIAIALATTFFKNRFSQEERKSGPVNYVMGLCFITEGAIPFAAADPWRVILSCALGSGVAGALSMLFGCACPAPHGGLFVFPVMHNVLAYFAALVVGSLIGMVLLALLKQKKS